MKNRLYLWSCRDHQDILPKQQAPASNYHKIIDLFGAVRGLSSSRFSGNVTAIYCSLFRAIVEKLLKPNAYAAAVTLGAMHSYATAVLTNRITQSNSSLITHQGHTYGQIRGN